jgi:hypothetical protein
MALYLCRSAQTGHGKENRVGEWGIGVPYGSDGSGKEIK